MRTGASRRPHGGSGPKGACAVKINVALVKCGRCGKKYSNPLTHQCVTRMDRKTPVRPSKVKPKLTVKCGSCGKPLGNPLTHACVTRTDFRKRKADAAKPKAKPATNGNAHEYTTCDDDDCHKFQCKIYKEGKDDGVVLGRQLGYAEGFPDGMAACPLPHQG